MDYNESNGLSSSLITEYERLGKEFMDIQEIYKLWEEVSQPFYKSGQLQGWTFELDTAKRRFGVCKVNRKIISLSKHLATLNESARVKNTMLHEIAHALVPHAHHNYEWQRVAREIGCDGQRQYSSEAVVKPQATFKSTCPNCAKSSEGFRRTYSACGKCCRMYNRGKFSTEFLLVWSRN